MANGYPFLSVQSGGIWREPVRLGVRGESLLPKKTGKEKGKGAVEVLMRRCSRLLVEVVGLQYKSSHPCVGSLPLVPPFPISIPGGSCCSAALCQPHPHITHRFISRSATAQMPTVSVNRDKLFEKMGRTYSETCPFCLCVQHPQHDLRALSYQDWLVP